MSIVKTTLSNIIEKAGLDQEFLDKMTDKNKKFKIIRTTGKEYKLLVSMGYGTKLYTFKY